MAALLLTTMRENLSTNDAYMRVCVTVRKYVHLSPCTLWQRIVGGLPIADF